MNLTLLTHYIPTPKEDYQLIADLTIPTKDEYCARFGYRHLIHAGPYGNDRLYWAIQRLQLIYDYLFAGINDVDAVWALNPQSLITSLKIDVADYLTPEHDFFVCADVNGINMASFVVRKTEWTKRYLEHLLKLAPNVNHGWWEQMAVIRTYQLPEWAPKIKLLDHPSLNSYLYSRLYNRPDTTPGQWARGHLVLSFPGTTFADRLKLIPEMQSPANIDR